jgi:putative redox protein
LVLFPAKLQRSIEFMATATVKYLGDLRTECTHLASGTTILTDAPVDNKGKGEMFSPTDLVATAYASCMITIMGIYCNERNIAFTHAEATVTKIMGTGPRRITGITISVDLTGNQWDADTAEHVIRAGKACPVAHSVHPEIEITFEFHV